MPDTKANDKTEVKKVTVEEQKATAAKNEENKTTIDVTKESDEIRPSRQGSRACTLANPSNPPKLL